jgi:hypothetical protein
VKECEPSIDIRQQSLLDLGLPLGRLFVQARRPDARKKEGVVMDLPKCQKCNNGLLIPLSDYGQDGASVQYKAWACTNPDCGFSIRIDKGEVSYGKRIEPKH